MNKLHRIAVRPFTKYLSQLIFSTKGSKGYWETRYALGGSSGGGSYGRLAEFKAEVLNDLIAEFHINTIIELGCGDGNQTSLLSANVNYLGLDISPTVIKRNLDRFDSDPKKDFLVFDCCCQKNIRNFLSVDMAISLDCLYHLVEQDIYENYLKTLFDIAKYVVIYASDDENIKSKDAHVCIRAFTPYIAEHFKTFRLVRKIDNKYHSDQYDKSGTDEWSWSDFFVYRKIET